MNRKTMPQIMHPRLITCPIIADNPSYSAKPLKCLPYGSLLEGISFFGEEEVWSIHLVLSVIRDVISRQHLVQIRANRNLSRTIEPSGVDDDYSPFEIH